MKKTFGLFIILFTLMLASCGGVSTTSTLMVIEKGYSSNNKEHWIKAYLRDCNGCSGHDIGDVIVNIGKNKFIGKEWEGIINQVAKELGYEINNILIFKFKQNIQLNSVEEKARIRKNIQDMKDVFYGVVPKDHYRYL